MPKDKKPADRYRRIHEIFTRRSGKNAVIKLEWLADELGISLRRLSDDMKHMREKGAPFEYVPALRGWRYEENRNFAIVDDQLYSEDEVANIQMAIDFLNRMDPGSTLNKLPGIFKKIYKASRNWNTPKQPRKHIYFDPLPRYEGNKHLAFFLNAIEEERRVSFQYRSFRPGDPGKTVLFDPWFLRHYDRRWYVGGFSHDPEEEFVRTFPLERIEGVPSHAGWFHDKPAEYDAATYWQHIYGITVPKEGKKVEEVVLEFTLLQGRYFSTTPFFEPYNIVEESSEKLVVSMHLIPNIDLIRKLASMGNDVKVLAPKSLGEEMRAFFEQALGRYGSV